MLNNINIQPGIIIYSFFTYLAQEWVFKFRSTKTPEPENILCSFKLWFINCKSIVI
jgi:hypothetical protein